MNNPSHPPAASPPQVVNGAVANVKVEGLKELLKAELGRLHTDNKALWAAMTALSGRVDVLFSKGTKIIIAIAFLTGILIGLLGLQAGLPTFLASLVT